MKQDQHYMNIISLKYHEETILDAQESLFHIHIHSLVLVIQIMFMNLYEFF